MHALENAHFIGRFSFEKYSQLKCKMTFMLYLYQCM